MTGDCIPRGQEYIVLVGDWWGIVNLDRKHEFSQRVTWIRLAQMWARYKPIPSRVSNVPSKEHEVERKGGRTIFAEPNVNCHRNPLCTPEITLSHPT
jgi:hypothetical protein